VTVARADRGQDAATVEGFGREWTAFDQSGVDEADLRRVFVSYFAVFPWDRLAPDAHGIDIGCGSGRWAQFVAPRVGRLTCVDASEDAVGVAGRTLAGHANVEIRLGSAGALPFPDGTFDFGYSLGVLHHTPDPEAALHDCVRVLRPGAPFLVYVYYALDGRPGWYRALWRASDRLRRAVSRFPFGPRFWTSQVVAALVYWPLARGARLLALLDVPRRFVDALPLTYYRDKPLYMMRNDALDRFGTRVEHRFTRAEMHAMLERVGVGHIEFSNDPPYWVAVGLIGRPSE